MPFALTLIISAFLLFLVQPMVARVILPWFGGSPSLWTLCMIFFQMLLLLGYSYAHFLTTKFSAKRQSHIHLAVVLSSLFFIPPLPGASWKPSDLSFPEIEILYLLIAVVGIPYFLLSTTAPLMQVWYAKRFRNRSPYRLYAWSNAASLVALLSYPLIFETQFSVLMQGRIWAGLYLIFAGSAAYCAYLNTFELIQEKASRKVVKMQNSEPNYWVWIGLPALASALLLAVTNELCQDVAVMPFLWVLPLALYLLSFILCFDFERIYNRLVFLPLGLISLYLVGQSILQGSDLPLFVTIAYWLGMLFVFCMLCHGELVRRKPGVDKLTLYYLCISAGGALGGISIGIIAPRIFSDFYELPILLVLIPLAVAATLLGQFKNSRSWASAFLIAAMGLAGYVEYKIERPENIVAKRRNFYGVLRIEDAPPEDRPPTLRSMYHGRIIHGAEYLDAGQEHIPLTYYGRGTGVELALRVIVPKERSRKIGVVGLGAGSMAGHGRAGDHVVFYEINPLSREFANQYFKFVPECPCTTEVVMGDARISLEREEPRDYDLIVLDAFSGDAIPIHLLTEEAVSIYLKHLAPGGVLAVHISNWYVNLAPVTKGIAEKLGLQALLITSEDSDDEEIYGSDWVLMAREKSSLSNGFLRRSRNPAFEDIAPVYWTDDFSSLMPIVNWGFEEDS